MQPPLIGFKPFTKKEIGLTIATGLLNAVATSALTFGGEALESAIKPDASSAATTQTPHEAAKQAAAHSASEAAVDYQTDALQEGVIKYGIKGIEKAGHAAAEHGAHKLQHKAHHKLHRHDSMKDVLAPLDKKPHTATASGLMFAEGASAAKLGFIIGSAIGTPAIGGPIGAGIAAFVNTIILATGARVMINNKSLGSYIQEYTDPGKHPGIHMLATTAVGAAYGSLLLPGIGSAIGAGVGLMIGAFYAFKNSETGKHLAKWLDSIGYKKKYQKQTGEWVSAGLKVGTGALFGFMLGGPIGAAIGAAATAGVLILAKAWQHFKIGDKLKQGFHTLRQLFSKTTDTLKKEEEPLLPTIAIAERPRPAFTPLFGMGTHSIGQELKNTLRKRKEKLPPSQDDDSNSPRP